LYKKQEEPSMTACFQSPHSAWNPTELTLVHLNTSFKISEGVFITHFL